MSDNKEDLISSFKLDHEGDEKKEVELLKTANKYLLSQNSDAELLKSVFNKVVSFVVVAISFLYVQFVLPNLSVTGNVVLLVCFTILLVAICLSIRNKLVRLFRS